MWIVPWDSILIFFFLNKIVVDPVNSTLTLSEHYVNSTWTVLSLDHSLPISFSSLLWDARLFFFFPSLSTFNNDDFRPHPSPGSPLSVGPKPVTMLPPYHVRTHKIIVQGSKKIWLGNPTILVRSNDTTENLKSH